jgi:hypothetical protein
MSEPIEFSPAIPWVVPFDVQKRIQELRGYLDPKNHQYDGMTRGGSFLAVTCGNSHIVLAALSYSFWCRIVWDSIIVNLLLWKIISDLTVTHA